MDWLSCFSEFFVLSYIFYSALWFAIFCCLVIPLRPLGEFPLYPFLLLVMVPNPLVLLCSSLNSSWALSCEDVLAPFMLYLKSSLRDRRWCLVFAGSLLILVSIQCFSLQVWILEKNENNVKKTVSGIKTNLWVQLLTFWSHTKYEILKAVIFGYCFPSGYNHMKQKLKLISLDITVVQSKHTVYS